MLLRFLFLPSPYRLQCHTSASRMPHLNRANATLQQVKWLAFGVLRCGICIVCPRQTDDALRANRPCVRGKQTICSEATEQTVQKQKREA